MDPIEEEDGVGSKEDEEYSSSLLALNVAAKLKGLDVLEWAGSWLNWAIFWLRSSIFLDIESSFRSLVEHQQPVLPQEDPTSGSLPALTRCWTP